MEFLTTTTFLGLTLTLWLPIVILAAVIMFSEAKESWWGAPLALIGFWVAYKYLHVFDVSSITISRSQITWYATGAIVCGLIQMFINSIKKQTQLKKWADMHSKTYADYYDKPDSADYHARVSADNNYKTKVFYWFVFWLPSIILTIFRYFPNVWDYIYFIFEKPILFVRNFFDGIAASIVGRPPKPTKEKD